MTDRRVDEAGAAADDMLGELGKRTRKRRGAPVELVEQQRSGKTFADIVDDIADKAIAVRPRQSPSTTTAGGLLHRSIYVTADEWRAVKLAALAEGTTAADIVRRAIRAALDVRG